MNVNTEQTIMQIIASSGDARSLSFEALRLAKEGKICDAHEKLLEAKKKLLSSHSAQMNLIVEEANGEPVEISLLMIHAQDHLMTTMLAKDLISEIVEFYEK